EEVSGGLAVTGRGGLEQLSQLRHAVSIPRPATPRNRKSSFSGGPKCCPRERNVARVGHLDRSNQGDSCNLLRTDTPKRFQGSSPWPDGGEIGPHHLPGPARSTKHGKGCLCAPVRSRLGGTGSSRKSSAPLLPG